MAVGGSDGLTAEQRDAIASDLGFVKIIAGPGTGKTYCLGHRIAQKIKDGVDPKRILAASFTNEACAALRAQLYTLVGDEAVNEIDIFTFHSFSRHIIERERQITSPGAPSLAVADEWDTRTFVKGLAPELTAKMVRSMRSADLQKLDAFDAYLARLDKHNMVDFRSLVVFAQKLAREIAPSYDHVFVDEFQDTSLDQFTLLKEMLAGNPRLNVTVVGDPNQAIYGFAEPHFSPFDEFDRICSPVTFHLTGNFRSTQQLVEFTNTQMPIAYPQVSTRPETMGRPTLQVCSSSPYSGSPPGGDAALVREIRRVRERFGTVTVLVYTNKAVAHIIELLRSMKIPCESGFNKAMIDHKNSRLAYFLFRYVVQEREIQLISLLDCAGVLSRSARSQLESLTNGFTLSIIEAFPQLKRIKNKSLLETLGKELDSVVQVLRSATDFNTVRESVRRALEVIPGASFNDTHVRRLLDTIETRSGRSDNDIPLIYQFMNHQFSFLSGSEDENPVQVRTIHSSKGLEWPAVIMPYLGTEDAYRFYQPQSNDPGYRKALYVGMSRARDSLSLQACGFTGLTLNPKLSITGELAVTERMRAQRNFPKLFSPLQFSRRIHQLIRLL